jgi:hypothetical protein
VSVWLEDARDCGREFGSGRRGVYTKTRRTATEDEPHLVRHSVSDSDSVRSSAGSPEAACEMSARTVLGQPSKQHRTRPNTGPSPVSRGPDLGQVVKTGTRKDRSPVAQQKSWEKHSCSASSQLDHPGLA